MYIKLSFLSFLSISCLLCFVLALPAPGVVEVTGLDMNGVRSHNGENAIRDMAIRDDKEHEQDPFVGRKSSESSYGAVTIQPLKISGDYKGFHADVEVHKDGAVVGGGGGHSNGGHSSSGGSSSGSGGRDAIPGGSGAAVGHKAQKGSSRRLLPETTVMALLLGLIGLVRI
ncbi:hypothetical protein AB5N19_00875 [Seiridium cardinale]